MKTRVLEASAVLALGVSLGVAAGLSNADVFANAEHTDSVADGQEENTQIENSQMQVSIVPNQDGEICEKDYTIYLKGDEIYFDYIGEEPIKLTENLYGEEDEIHYFYVDDFVHLFADGKTLLYPDNGMEEGFDEFFFDLYLKDLSKPEEPARLIAEAVHDIEFTEDESLLTYWGLNGVFQTDYLNTETLFGGMIEEINFEVREDGKMAYFVDENEKLYRWEDGKGSVCIENNVMDLYRISEDYRTIYFLCAASENERYVKVWDEEKQHYTEPMREESEYTYSTEMPDEIPLLIDFIEDDYAEADKTATLTEEIKERNQVRKELEWEYIPLFKLYYNNGETSTLLTENVSGWIYNENPAGHHVYMYATYENKNIEKIKLSEVMEAEDALKYRYVRDVLDGRILVNPTVHIALGHKVYTLGECEVYKYYVTEDGSTLWFTAKYKGETEYNLYKVSIAGQTLGEIDLYDTDVISFNFFENGDVYYYRSSDTESSVTSLYINKEHIDSATDMEIVWFYRMKEKFFYIKYSNPEKTRRSLMYYDGEKSTLIYDTEVLWYAITGKDTVLYFEGYSEASKKGDLYYHTVGGEAVLIDEDCERLLVPHHAGGYNQLDD